MARSTRVWATRVHRTGVSTSLNGQDSWRAVRVQPHLFPRLKAAGIREPSQPSAVQMAVFEALMPRLPGERASPRAAVIRWPTGSGKTLAYALPLLERVRHGVFGVQAIVVTPTRELCLQIYKESAKFCKPLGLRSVAVYGGASVAEQIGDLKRGAETA